MSLLRRLACNIVYKCAKMIISAHFDFIALQVQFLCYHCSMPRWTHRQLARPEWVHTWCAITATTRVPSATCWLDTWRHIRKKDLTSVPSARGCSRRSRRCRTTSTPIPESGRSTARFNSSFTSSWLCCKRPAVCAVILLGGLPSCANYRKSWSLNQLQIDCQQLGLVV